MPLYSFVCPACFGTKEIVRPMNESDKPVVCSCGTTMNRDYQVDMPNVGNREYAIPLHSDALAIMPSQRKEHEEKFPDIKLDEECRPVFTNYNQHNAYLEKTGFVKLPQRKRRKATRIV